MSEFLHRKGMPVRGVCYTTGTMLKIRLQRIGRRNNPSYRVVVVDSRAAAKKGKPVELLGTHDTIRKTTTLNDERIKHWISQGAQVSDTMHNILIKNGVIEGVKVNVLPKKSPIAKKKEQGDAKAESGDTAQATDSAAPDAADTEAGVGDDAAGETPSDADAAADAPKADEAEKPETPEPEKSDAPEAKDADAGTDTEEEKPQAPSPQDTPSAEG